MPIFFNFFFIFFKVLNNLLTLSTLRFQNSRRLIKNNKAVPKVEKTRYFYKKGVQNFARQQSNLFFEGFTTKYIFVDNS